MGRPAVLVSKEARNRALLGTLAGLVLLAAGYFLIEPYIYTLYDTEQVRQLVQQFGAFGPVAIIVLQAVQVFTAPLPGPLFMTAAGIMYGPYWGAFWGMIGAGIGSAAAILATKRWGRPIVEEFVTDEMLERFDRTMESYGLETFFIIFLLPGFPDDAICFLCGLTRLPTRKLVLIAVIGRFPGLFAMTLAGGGIADKETTTYLAIFTALLIASALSLIFHKTIISSTTHPADG